jgi:DNA polymerase III epsilon subunit-like protein
MTEIVILDTETSGIGDEDRILELAYLIEVTKGDEIKYVPFRTLCKVDHIKDEAMEIHHITPEMLVDAPHIMDTEEFRFLVEANNPETILVTYNGNFDLNMLKKEGFENKMKHLDLFPIMKVLLPQANKHTLQYLRYYLKIYQQEDKFIQKLHNSGVVAHSALGDVVVTYLLFARLRAKYGIDKLFELAQGTPDDMKMPFGKYKGTLISEIDDKSYLEWLVSKTDDETIKAVAKKYL